MSLLLTKWRGALLWVGLLAPCLGACGSSSTVTIFVNSFTFPEGIQGLVVVYTENGRSKTFTANEFADSPSPTFDVGDRGEAELSFAIEMEGQIVSSGNIPFELRNSFEWAFSITWGTDEELFACFYCSTADRFELAESVRRVPGEAIWISWGGVPRSNEDF